MIEAFEYISEALPNAKLVIGGGNHPSAAGYVESMKSKHAANPRIEFTGYVHEDRLPDVFQRSSVAVMPYSSSTGSSGVAHLACTYGVPIVCADIPDFRQMSDGEGMAIEFYKPGDSRNLADCLICLLTDPAKQQEMAEQNFSSALRMTMPNIVLKYLRHFELEQRSVALRHITRFRKLPNWVPSKFSLLKFLTHNTLGWVHRSALYKVPPRPGKNKLLENEVNSDGEIAGARTRISQVSLRGDGTGHGGNGNGKAAVSRTVRSESDRA
jgi:hypothetical protein